MLLQKPYHTAYVFTNFSDDTDLCNVDTISVSKKLHDVQKNSSQDLLSKDSIAYDLFTTTNGAPSPFVIEPQSKFKPVMKLGLGLNFFISETIVYSYSIKVFLWT